MMDEGQIDGRDRFFFNVKGRGVKVFPRCGSTTLREAWPGKKIPAGVFAELEPKIIVVRHPWDRLMSVYEGMITALGKDQPIGHGLPESCRTLNGLLEHLVTADFENMDWHTQPMFFQLEGYDPDPADLYTLDRVVTRPPHGLNKPSKRRKATPDVQRQYHTYDPFLRDVWEDRYQDDFDLYQLAREVNK